ncbi:MAG: polymer-forming cytoskeletal protein [Micavibrio sp.]
MSKFEGERSIMFHRTNAGSNSGDREQNEPYQAEDQPQPEQRSFHYQGKVIEQSAVERYARGEPEQFAAMVPPANQSQPLTQNQFYVYESTIQAPEEEKDTPIMTPADNDIKSESKNEQGAPASRIDIPGGVFSRPGQQAQVPGRVPGAYPGAYPGATSFGQPSAAMANDPAAGRKLYIGQGITLSGEIEACDHLVVEGTVEAALKGASVLEIAEAGAYFGTVDIDEATIAGRFEGDLTVRGRLTVKTTGSITGSITYKELAIEAGATLDGKLSPLDAKAGGARRPEASNKSSSGRKPTDFGAELPFEGKAVAAE